jgi:DNA-binding transcriptional regulator GbsR (MarR family)
MTTGLSAIADDLVEQTGLFFNSLGLPRAAGQVFGYLMVCEPAEQAARELAVGLGLSAASISSSTRLLAQIGAVEQRHRIGDRKTYYRLRSDFWFETARGKMQAWDRIASLGRQIRESGYQGRTDSIDEVIAFSEFWEEELPEVAKRWQQRRASMKEGA